MAHYDGACATPSRDPMSLKD